MHLPHVHEFCEDQVEPMEWKRPMDRAVWVYGARVRCDMEECTAYHYHIKEVPEINLTLSSASFKEFKMAFTEMALAELRHAIVSGEINNQV